MYNNLIEVKIRVHGLGYAVPYADNIFGCRGRVWYALRANQKVPAINPAHHMASLQDEPL